uniref:Neurogenic locus notch homolog protein 4 n=1 Tax=Chinchilla lanigera TaxID=34839 RepID=A0A8C2VC98_CHILA
MQTPSLLLLLLLLLLLPLPGLLCGSAPEPCANGGTCLGLPQGPGACRCAPGFLGETCQLPDPCRDAQLCQNGGSCRALLPTPPSSPSAPSPPTPSFFCTCPSGFTGERCQTQLEDPCPPFFCSKKGRCHLQAPGRPQCSCTPGWTGEQCQLRDFCSANPCANGGVCLTTYPQIQCRCPPGFEGHTCERDVNECFLDPGPCPEGTSCHNILGSFRCLCPAGQEGSHCALQKGPCPAGGCPNGGTCQLVPGGDASSHLCLCPPGADLTAPPPRAPRSNPLPPPRPSPGWDCSQDVDECEAQGAPRCRNGGTCQNSAGGFHCVCVSGWGGAGCEENLDDCVDATCAPGATCIDRVGSFSCLCPPGRTGLLCHLEDMCLSQPCHREAQCSTNPLTGSTLCLCQPGYSGPTCHQDLDECQMAQQGPSPCEHGGSCLNTPGSFNCLCPPGYTGSRCEADHNECLSQPCHPGSTCLDLLAAFHCLCPPGTAGRASEPCTVPDLPGPHCEREVDECLSGPCPTGATCLDLPGAFSCLCPSGLTGPLCEVPLCAPTLCQPKQKCQELDHEAHCLCPDGSPGCTPADNCTCHHGHCLRSSCVCDAGWTGPECEAELGGCISAPCAHGGTCHPQPSGYNCSCPAGYTGEAPPKPCTPGGEYEGSDEKGGEGRGPCSHAHLFPPGPTCLEEVTACHSEPCLNGGSCSPSPGGYSCTCRPSHTGPQCQTAVDHCQKPCPRNSRCLRSGPSFQCLCLQGWTGALCSVPLSPCQKAALSQGVEVSALCQNGGLCIDSGSSHFCHCPPGFQGSICQDSVHPCESRPCQNGATCMAQPKGYLCQCAPGYSGQNCSELNACQSQPCHNHGTCTPKPGGFHCACPPGFVGLRCEGDVDECLDRPCHPTGTAACRSLANAFHCECLPGHTGQWGCEVQIDPCQSQPCSHGGSCEVTAGPPPGFSCRCPKGFEGPTCSHRAPSCGLHHCHHGGLCLPSPKPASPPRCACLGGFGDPDCLTPPASQGCGPPSPCLHNGSCSETPGLGGPGFRCSCPPDSPGPRCQKPGAKGCEGRGGDGACDSGCSGPGGDWDGGDCSLGVPDPWKGCPSHSQCWLLFRDGQCHPQCDSEECLFDGYDCEPPPTCTPAYDQYCRDHFHNGHCEKGCDTAECGWDGGDCRPGGGDAEWGPSLALLVVLSPPALDRQLLHLARVLSLALRVGLWVKKDPDGRDMVFPYPGARAEEELMGTREPAQRERAAPHPQPPGKDTDSLSSGFVVVMGVDLSRCGPDRPAARCPWDPGLLLRFLAAMAAVGALEPLLPGALLAAHPSTGTAPPAHQLPWLVLCSPVAGVLLLALAALLVLQLIRRRRREHGALWLPPGFIRRPRTQQARHRRRPPLGEDSIGLKALKPEAEVEEDGVVMCTGPQEGEEVPGQRAEDTAPHPKCQPWPLSIGCGALPQVAMLTPPQESELEASDVDTFGPDGVTPLMSAVCCGGVEPRTFQGAWLGSPEPWEPLLDGGACPQAHTVGSGETPLHLAARFSRPTAARRLLEAGANPNEPDQAGRTPLHTAVAADAREVCQLLLSSRQTAVDARTEDGTTPLILAARLAVEDLVEELISARADVGARDKWGKTALHWAAAVNNTRAARSLLQAGADKDAQDSREQTPLFLAAREGAVEVAQLLLRLGAARGLRDQAGLAPGDIARQRNHWDLLTLLEGAEPAEARHKSAPSGGGARGGPPRGGRRLSTGMRGPRPIPASVRERARAPAGRGDLASADDWPCDWVTLGACCPAASSPIPPPCLTPSPERGSPQVAWGLPAHHVMPLNLETEGQR